jgi:uncharacterized protein
MKIKVKISARASRNKIEKINQGEYKVWLTAPPVDGKANTMLIKILADYFHVSKSSLKITSGKAAKNKIMEIS